MIIDNMLVLQEQCGKFRNCVNEEFASRKPCLMVQRVLKTNLGNHFFDTEAEVLCAV